MSKRQGLDKIKVVETALEIIHTEGAQALTLNRVAAKLGVKIPSLYNHINGLPELQRELAIFSARKLGERLSNAALGKSGPQALVSIAQAYRDFVKENPDLYLIGQRSFAFIDPQDQDLISAQDQATRAAFAVIQSFGLSGMDAIHAVRGLRSLAHGFSTLEISAGFGLPVACDESYQYMVDIFIRGLLYPMSDPDKENTLDA